MYIKTKNGYDYLMKSERTNDGIKHQIIAYLGKTSKTDKLTKKKIIEIFEKSDGKCQNPDCQNRAPKMLTLSVKNGADYFGVHNDIWSNLEAVCSDCANEK